MFSVEKRGLGLVRPRATCALAQVLQGEAVFAYDPDHAGKTARVNGVDPPNDQLKFDFVQELLNQVVTRKRQLTETQADGTQGAATYQMVEEDGLYDLSTHTAIRQFRENFGMGNTRVDFVTDPVTNQVNYLAADDTSDIIRKLTKDYQKRGLTGTAQGILHNIVDQATLVGNDIHLYSESDLETSPPDQQINAPVGNGTDSGLYELYVNVVRRFVDGMITEAKRYAGLSGSPKPKDAWYSRGDKATNGYGPSDCVTGTACVGSHGAGMSYSYGGKQTIDEFNVTVSTFKTPPNAQYNSLSLIGSYKGNLFPQGATNAVGELVEGKIGATTNKKKWPGLKKDGEYTNDASSPFYWEQWAGIDCSGLVVQSLRYAKQQAAVSLGDICTDYVDTTNICSDRTGIDTRTGLLDTGVSRFFNGGNQGFVHFYWPRDDAGDNVKKIHRGDVVQYAGHISIVYSERWGESKKQGNYDIIHAYGTNTYRDKQENLRVFSRKVLITADDLPGKKGKLEPQGFGRVKLWE
jgi:hypothetical protein